MRTVKKLLPGLQLIQIVYYIFVMFGYMKEPKIKFMLCLEFPKSEFGKRSIMFRGVN